MRGWWCAALFIGVLGCASEEDRVVIGFFAIEGTLTDKCAEAGLLAAPEKTSLRAYLQRFDTMIHWDDGSGVKMGQYSITAHSFEIEHSVFVDMRQDQTGDELPDCTMERRQVIAAT